MMHVQDQIKQYFASLSEAKAVEMQVLHGLILAVLPEAELWYDDGKDAAQKTVCNPTIGYGRQLLQYANGANKPFFQIGLSANQTGISIYIIGLKDKYFLKQHFGTTIGNASLTAYCIKFKTIRDIRLAVLQVAIHKGIDLVGQSK
jgi:hypothetical protein